MSVIDSDLMTVEDVAGYLRVAERTIYDWAQKGEIPCGKLGSSWRFRRSDIDRWLAEKFNRKAPSRKVHTGEVELSTLLSPKAIHFFPAAVRKEEVLRKLCRLLAESPLVKDGQELESNIFHRENLMSTGLGRGLAVPHVRLDSIHDVVVAAAICAGGVQDYEALDDEPVQLVFMIAASTAQHEMHIKLLAQIASRLKNRKLRDRLIRSHTTEDVLLTLAAGE